MRKRTLCHQQKFKKFEGVIKKNSTTDEFLLKAFPSIFLYNCNVASSFCLFATLKSVNMFLNVIFIQVLSIFFIVFLISSCVMVLAVTNCWWWRKKIYIFFNINVKDLFSKVFSVFSSVAAVLFYCCCVFFFFLGS